MNFLQTFCIAIAFPDPQALSSLASSLRIEGTIEELCRNKVRKVLIDYSII